MAIRIVTDSSADLPRPVAEALEIAVVPLNIHFGSETFREGIDLSHAEFYERLVREAPSLPKTSAASVGQFLEAYEPILAQGDDIISVHLSAALSGTFNTARLAAQECPEGRVTAVDSRNVSMCLGWTAIAAAEAAMRGEGFTDILTLIADMIPRLRIPSFLETLAFVRYGGRIGGAEAFLGTLLNVKPILHIEGGKVVPLEKVRTRARALDRLMDLARDLAPFEDLAVMHTHAPETAEALADRLGELHPRQNILIAEAGVAMGSHVGPGAVGICAVTAR